MAETKITMLTIKEAAALVDGLTEYRVRELCKSGELHCFKAGKKYLINKDILYKYLNGELVVQ
ncbi:DNA binding domain-containing protein, excisionase family [Ruminococcus sp. YE71]|uniref:helix-turn-helix domain-containing protein n=1 Tax=unclassified Ruminococcus TaxID=2608920 RepID=UPI000883E4A1|nr:MULTISPECIES: helix-turn-helix domain-containing protein [unclassified Ruminococcus]SDA20016.1 DNA binding domain-containing protein, excisionase family [Ruminococcus sp. YE78]SFW31705.1 DNA binding domain-containing protein, excisionase family [Ruminococcus sp. YE71]